MRSRNKVRRVWWGVMGGGLLAGASVAAQDGGQRVEITGSAIKRLALETSLPITVLRMDELKKEGISTVEQILGDISAMQVQEGTAQVVGTATGGASFADMRGLGANKTLVLLNGRRLANNAFDSSAPDLNMIPFAALERVEVLRDGASSLYGTDAIGGVINFITRQDFQGGVVTLGAEQPQHSGGARHTLNLGLGHGDLEREGFNLMGFLDYQEQARISGTQRPFNARVPSGPSSSTYPANYYQGGDSGNPAAPDCNSSPNLISDGLAGCTMTTARFIDYLPQTERLSAMVKGTFKLNENHRLGLEYLASHSRVDSLLPPSPYGGLYQNRTLPDGSPNPYYPGNPGSAVASPNIPLDPNYFEPDTGVPGLQPGFIHVKWRDLPNGARGETDTNTQDRFVASLEGTLDRWDYQAAFSAHHNQVRRDLANYSNGDLIFDGMLNGVLNPFGDQSAAGSALLAGASLAGNLENAHGQVESFDAHASRALADWFGAGRAQLAVGMEARHEVFNLAANPDFAALVVSSTGIAPDTSNAGQRRVYAGYAELDVPLFKTLEVDLAARYDKYSDFGDTVNPKFSFRYAPVSRVVLRGAFSTGFRAPSLYDVNATPVYSLSAQEDDPVNCPGGQPAPGKAGAANCAQQFIVLSGGNQQLKPEKSRNLTLGMVLEAAPDLNLGLDLWSITQTRSIDSLAEDTAFFDPAQYAAVFHRNGAGDLSTDGSQCPGPNCGYVDLRTQNLGDKVTRGVDLGADYRIKAGAYGTFDFGAQSTWVAKFQYQNAAGGPWVQNVGIYSGAGPVFRWQHRVEVRWSRGDLGLGLAGHYKSGYLDQDPSRRVGAYATFDAYAAWTPKKGYALTVGLRNLADRAPPFSNQTLLFQSGYDPRYTDPTGRAVYVRGSYAF